MPTTEASLSRKQIRDIFQRHKGAANALAAELEVSHVAVSKVLRGKDKSQRILDAAHARALELIKADRATNAA